MAKHLFGKKSAFYEILALQVEGNGRKPLGRSINSPLSNDGKPNHCFIREMAADGKPTPKSYMIGFSGNPGEFYNDLNKYVGAIITSKTVGFQTYGNNWEQVSDVSVSGASLYSLLSDKKISPSVCKIKSDLDGRKLQKAIRSMNVLGNSVSFSPLPDAVFGDTYDMRRIMPESYGTLSFAEPSFTADRLSKRGASKLPNNNSNKKVLANSVKSHTVKNGKIDDQPIGDYYEVHPNEQKVSNDTSRDIFSNSRSGNARPLPKVPSTFENDFAAEEALDID
jgi:hypothetical protein